MRYDINSFLAPQGISRAKHISNPNGIYRKFRRNLYRFGIWQSQIPNKKEVTNMTTRSKSPGMLLRNAGLFNPVLVQAVGLCPVVAMATSLRGSALLALVATVVITLSEWIASLCLKRVERWVRIALYILLGSVLVLPFMSFLEKNQPELFSSLGLYLPIMAVNSLVVLRCERFAVKIRPISALRDGLTASFGYAAVLILVGLVREALGSGSIGGFVFKPENNFSALLLPCGGFLILGFFAAVLRSLISAYWPKYLDKKQPKPHARQKKPKKPVPVEPEPLPDLTPDETPFSLEEIEATPFGAEQADEMEETETEEAVYTPVQPEPEPTPEPQAEAPLVAQLEPLTIEALEPLEAPQVGDVFTKKPTRAGESKASGGDQDLEALFNRSLDDVLEQPRAEEEKKS